MISGSMLRRAFISAANNIADQRRQVDALNVFPVPDGDTGTNMSMTMGAARRELQALQDTAGAGEVAGSIASALLWGARGNSGVILSLLFRGFAKGLHNKREAGSGDLVQALQIGVDSAYKAVMKPTEGTMLTVARESVAKMAEELERRPDIPPAELWEVLIDQAQRTLEHTPELLPVLKKAGVVDAGGKGLVIIFQGMGVVFMGGSPVPDEREKKTFSDFPDERNASGEYEGEITFTYCTEFIVIKDTKHSNHLALRAYLESIGDSVVVVEDEQIIKCHVHTDNPGNALQKALENGALTNLKIENMREQHAARKRLTSEKREGTAFLYKEVDPENEFGFVSVAAGEGIQSLFRDLGADNVVSGGQTMNPSTDNILAAIHATPARQVIVLPNNKNVIMSAEQAGKLADRSVYVLHTTTIPQGLAAMLAFDPDCNLAENQLAMVKASEKVGTGAVTFAARDSTFDGHKIKKNEILGIENNKISFVEKDAGKAVLRLARSMVKKDTAFVTLLYGQGITEEQAAETEAALRQRLPETTELILINGGQPIYYYILSVE